jgi:hypothetical protein
MRERHQYVNRAQNVPDHAIGGFEIISRDEFKISSRSTAASG